MAGFVGILHRDGAPASRADAAIADQMAAAMAHRGIQRSLLHDGPLVLIGTPRDRDTRATWDGRTLALTRDRAGAAPLFTAQAGELLLFGSELKALLTHPACPREVDWVGALAAEAMPLRARRHDSWFLGITPVEPGTTLRVGPDGEHVEQWGPYRLTEHDDRDDDALIAGYRDVLVRAVEDAIGDEPVGVMLSGGIDSVSVASIAARRGGVQAYTVVGQSTFGNGDAALAHAAATTLGLPLHPVPFRWREPIAADDWRRLLWLTETPFCGAQHYYKLHLHRHAAAATPGVRRMLSGEGSDEHSGADFANHGDDREDGDWDAYLAHLEARQRQGFHTLETLAVEQAMGRPVFARDALGPRPHPWAARFGLMHAGLATDILWRDDRLAAGMGMRAETPFCDPRVVDYVAGIPRRAWGRLFWKKRLLREAMRGIVPEGLRTTPKIPFFAGADARFTSSLLYGLLVADDHRLVREALGDGAHPVLAPGLIPTLLAELARDPERRLAGFLLLLVNLGLLQAMANDAALRPGPAMEIAPLPAVRAWDEDELRAELVAGELHVAPATVLALAPGVELVRPETGDATYILVDDTLRFVLDEPASAAWRAILRRLDGVAPLSTHLDAVDSRFADVAALADEALRFGVVAVA